MIRYLTHDQIDFEKWDDCIDRAVNGIFYAYSWYLDMTATPWDALVEDDYRAVMPLPRRKKFGIHYVYQPFFIQQLGVFSTYSLSGEVTLRFVKAIPDHFRFIDYQLNTYNQLQESENFHLGKRITYELDMISPYEVLKKQYSKNTLRNIKKAVKKGVFITPHGKPEEIINVFRKNRGRKIDAFSYQDYNVLKHLTYAGLHRGMVSIRSAYSQENNFCAGIIFFRSHKKAVFLFSGATPQARENGAMALLVDDFIREHAESELILDFEGSSIPNLARFYRGFGSKECVFLQMKINRLPGIIKPMVNVYQNLRKSFIIPKPFKPAAK